jgi:hypothetical protein
VGTRLPAPRSVVGFGGGEEQALLAVGGVVDGVSRFLQALSEPGGGVGVVFDQQDAHRRLLPARA